MKTLKIQIKRNTKLFFKDKGLFFTSLITPLILLVLYATFLANVYEDSFIMALSADGAVDISYIDNDIIKGCVGGQLISSILAVSCVTVAFCSNMLMVQDKFSGAKRDFLVSPVRSSTLSIAYYLSTLISTLIICLTATVVCLVYVAFVGFYMSALDVILLITDVFLLVMFGTAISSVVNYFLKSQGQVSAVGSIVSSCYGFLSGAYMPISQFSEGLRSVIGFLPGTYGTSLLRSHALRGAISALRDCGAPTESISVLEDIVDCNVYFFDTAVGNVGKYLILIISTALLIGAYVLINVLAARKSKGVREN